MNDKELRSELLQLLYEKRSDPWTTIGMNAIQNREQSEVIRIAQQLAEYGLIEFKMLNRHMGGQARISARGVDVIEGSTAPPIAMTIDQRQTIHISAPSNVQIGDNNIQQVQSSVVSLVSAIEKSSGTPEQKAEAKGLLRQFLAHPLVTAIAGAAVDNLLG
jgi:hypothetical protein